MGRGVSSGGGQSSLGYLFGSGEAPKPAANNPPAEVQSVNNVPPSKPAAPQRVDVTKQMPAGIHSNSADGQNTGNFITVLFASLPNMCVITKLPTVFCTVLNNKLILDNCGQIWQNQIFDPDLHKAAIDLPNPLVRKRPMLYIGI